MDTHKHSTISNGSQIVHNDSSSQFDTFDPIPIYILSAYGGNDDDRPHYIFAFRHNWWSVRGTRTPHEYYYRYFHTSFSIYCYAYLRQSNGPNKFVRSVQSLNTCLMQFGYIHLPPNKILVTLNNGHSMVWNQIKPEWQLESRMKF